MLCTFALKLTPVSEALRSISQNQAGETWMKAAITGSIWASLEIILGSFLHNLRIPFSGSILAIMSVILLVAFLQVWPDRGIIWRAGLICAIMKSVSPSAVILGPMTGIMLEAFLLEGFILMLGMNLAGYLAGGAAAVLSSLIHKAATLLVLYGFNLVQILAHLYFFSARQIGSGNGDPSLLLGIIIVIYATAGMAGAFCGYLTGKSYMKTRKGPGTGITHQSNHEESLFRPGPGHKYSIILLLLNFCAVIISLTLLNRVSLGISLTAGLTYILSVIILYPASARKLMKPGVWLQFILIVLLSAFLWDNISGDSNIGIQGIGEGLKMIFRAIIIIMGFAAISTEMRNPLVKSILYNRGMADFYQSLSLSFSTLPSIIANLPSPGKLIRNRPETYRMLLETAESLLPVIEKEQTHKPALFILTGRREQGKTKFIKKLTEILIAEGKTVGGFLSEGIHNGLARAGFHLTDIQTGETATLCSIEEKPGTIKQGRYYFNTDIIGWGCSILEKALANSVEIIAIDEVGPMELNGGGWHNSIAAFLSGSAAIHIWTVRENLAEKAAKKWNVGDVHIIDISLITPEEVAGMVTSVSAGRQ